MAKRRTARRAKSTKSARKSKPARRSGKRPSKKAAPRRKTAPKKKPARKAARASAAPKTPRLDRARRTLEETVPTPPSSLDMNRRGTAARSGRAEMAQRETDHRGMSSAIAAGDADVDVEDAYFTGDEAPGGDNPAPDEEVVDEIGKALGLEYEDNEELKASDKVTERDKHRWELDPASSEDYRERKK